MSYSSSRYELRLIFYLFATKPTNPNSKYQLEVETSKTRFDFVFEPIQVHIVVVVAIVVVVRRTSGMTNYAIIVINCVGHCHHRDILG